MLSALFIRTVPYWNREHNSRTQSKDTAAGDAIRQMADCFGQHPSPPGLLLAACLQGQSHMWCHPR